MKAGRKALRLWHRCFGIGAALWLLLLSLTGSAIVFYDELDRWLNPELRTIAAPLTDTPKVEAAIEAAGPRLPGFMPRFIDLPNTAHDSIMMVGSVSEPEGDERPAQLFADPRDGTVLGWRIGGTLAFDRHHLMDTLYALHMDLMLGPAMAWFFGLVALLWALDHVPAAMLAIPRITRWWTALRVKGRGLRRVYDLHRAPGLWLFPVTLTLAITGLCLTWQEETRDVVGLVSPVSERLHYEFPDVIPPRHPISVDQALARVRRAGGREIDSVQLLPRKGIYAIRVFDDRDLDGIGRLWIYVTMIDGRIVTSRHDNGESGGDHFFAWQYPLHSGKAFGFASRLAILVGGLATAILCVTGLCLLLLRITPRRTSVIP